MVKFNPRQFLAQVGNGKTTLTCPKQQFLFSQGDAANAVFNIQIREGRHVGGGHSEDQSVSTSYRC
jgi:hypothetical protein